MNMALEYKLYVLSDLYHAIGEASTNEDREAKRAWEKADEIMAHFYILGSMSNVLQAKHENMGTFMRFISL